MIVKKDASVQPCKQTKISREWDDRLWEGEELQGTYVVYSATPNNALPFVCDVDIHSLCESNIRELRAGRSVQAKRQAPREDTLHEEIAVIFGAGLSAKEAVATLERLALQIRKNGLLIGRARFGGDFYVETIKGEIVR